MKYESAWFQTCGALWQLAKHFRSSGEDLGFGGLSRLSEMLVDGLEKEGLDKVGMTKIDPLDQRALGSAFEPDGRPVR